MGGVKRKDAPSGSASGVKKQKTDEVKAKHSKSTKPKKSILDEENEDFGGFSDEDKGVDVENNEPSGLIEATGKPSRTVNGGSKQFKLETSSAEAHAKQRALAKERKANKPNADEIARSKKIWERLRRKSHVPPEERKQLVTELFDIITGRVRDFVFKHDSVRVIQCALKYANQEQKRTIAQELQSDIRDLVESRYAKFLVAKMIQDKDEQIRDVVIPEFYGHVRRLINNPEASWIVDDIYRQVATSQQKANMLREWYGAEFALFHRKPDAKLAAIATHDDTADLKVILERSPEKRKPMLQYLLQMINSLVQKKMTGFTMLHDAMLQYFLSVPPGSAEHTEFLEILKGDIEPKSEGGGGDLFRNLAFTKSGSRLVSLAFAYSSSKDRKIIVRVFKDAIEMMAHDQYGKIVLVVMAEILDDTPTTNKNIMSEVLGKKTEDETQKLDRLEQIISNLNARVPLLFPMAGPAKWLVSDADKVLLDEVFEIRKTTSKKDVDVRRKEIVEEMSESVLEVVAQRASSLVKSSFGCQFITETLLASNGENKDRARAAVALLAAGDPTEDDHVAKDAAAGRMLKTLTMGGNFDPTTKQVKLADPPLKFGAALFPVVKKHLVEWAISDSSFVIVAFLESLEMSEAEKDEIRKALKKGKKRIESAAQGEQKGSTEGERSDGAAKKTKTPATKGNAGARILLEKIN